MPGPEPRLDDLLGDLRLDLQKAGIAEAARDLRLLAGGLLDLSPAALISRGRDAVSSADAERLREAAARRAAGEPVHRILGYREFYGLTLRLSPGTLEPRPDTEILVDAMLPFLLERAKDGGQPKVLDLGTGTGAICLALLAECPQARGTGVDISDDALATATANADINGLNGRFRALKSDWFSEVGGRFDAIVSNPPYIPSGDLAGLDREVREHDPQKALDGGPDGLDPYRVIANHAADHLEPGGWVGVEFGWNQQRDVRAIFEQAGFVMLEARRDYGGNDRVMIFAAAAR